MKNTLQLMKFTVPNNTEFEGVYIIRMREPGEV